MATAYAIIIATDIDRELHSCVYFDKTEAEDQARICKSKLSAGDDAYVRELEVMIPHCPVCKHQHMPQELAGGFPVCYPIRD